MHAIISTNASFDKALLSVAEGLRTNGVGVSIGEVISCMFLVLWSIYNELILSGKSKEIILSVHFTVPIVVHGAEKF